MDSNIMRLTEHITPSAGCFDVNDCLRPASVLDMLQDIAAKHAQKLGCGYETMLKKHRLWVLLRTRYEVELYPEFGRGLLISTWPQQGRLDFDRHYLLTGEDGTVFVRARSKWCVIDSDTRRLVKDTGVCYPESCPEDIALGPVTKPEIPAKGNDKGIFTAGLSDLDHNGHMNNARYADIVHNCLEPGDRLRAMSINYIHELSVGQSMEIKSLRGDGAVTVWGQRGGTVCFAALAELG